MIWAIIVAAGSGTRYGGPKQRALLAGRPLVEWAVQHLRGLVTGVALVVPPGEVDDGWPQVDAVVAGGATRSASVRAGLAAVPEDAAMIIVHDAARPAAPRALFEQVLGAVDLDRAEAAVAALPVTDTLRHLERGAIEREGVYAVQTPQAFRAAALRAAHALGDDATDDATLVERNGGRVVVVPGSPLAMKVTTPDDLRVLEALLCP